MDLSFLPAVNATLNGSCAVLLVIGLVLIRRRRIEAHKRCMIAAFVVSSLFLITYVTHYVWRATVMGGAHTPYHGRDPVKTFYYIMLASHILLAMTVPVLAIVLIRLGLTGRLAAHRRLARFAWPIWMYVSITGILIYVMLSLSSPAP